MFRYIKYCMFYCIYVFAFFGPKIVNLSINNFNNSYVTFKNYILKACLFLFSSIERNKRCMLVI